jgi:hypothetical protein
VRRLPVTLRALALVPLGTVAVQQARAEMACGDQARSCLQAAGQGWMHAAGIAVLVAFALLVAGGVARVARGDAGAEPAPPGLARLWALAAVGVLTACTGQELLAAAVTPGYVPLDGGVLAALPLCLAAGGVIALGLRVRRHAALAVRALAPRAPRPLPGRAADAALAPAAAPLTVPAPLAGAAAGRAPPRG